MKEATVYMQKLHKSGSIPQIGDNMIFPKTLNVNLALGNLGTFWVDKA